MTVCAATLDLGGFVQGEVPAPLEYTFLDSDGVPLNLTGFTAKFTWRAVPGTPTEASASVSNPTGGKATYIWTGPEFAVPGPHIAEMWVGNLTNRWASVRIVYTVRVPVGAVPAI
jgi:hypothetical protein